MNDKLLKFLTVAISIYLIVSGIGHLFSGVSSQRLLGMILISGALMNLSQFTGKNAETLHRFFRIVLIASFAGFLLSLIFNQFI